MRAITGLLLLAALLCCVVAASLGIGDGHTYDDLAHAFAWLAGAVALFLAGELLERLDRP